jgi:sugar O-acyltransferase (sialic acid O-acetyltransferase NeuD family)
MIKSHQGKFILLGGGGHAKVVVSTLKCLDSEICAIFDPNKEITELYGAVNLIHYSQDKYPMALAIIALGDNQKRAVIAKVVKHQFGCAIHPTAFIDKYVTLGEGSVTFAGVVVNRNTSIGKHVILNTGSIVEHDCSLGDFVHIAPNATICGGSSIGDRTLIGAGAVVLPGITIGQDVTIGSGAVVTKDVPACAKWVGSPAKPLINYHRNS